MERFTVKKEWQTSLTVACLVCLVAFWHYLYMRTGYAMSGESPTELRYVDWLITVPLQIVEFYLIVAAVNKALKKNAVCGLLLFILTKAIYI